MGIGVVASRLLALSLWPGVETIVDVTTFSEVVLKVVGCFPSNLNWESSVYGFCNFCLLFLYFSFKIVNVHIFLRVLLSHKEGKRPVSDG